MRATLLVLTFFFAALAGARSDSAPRLVELRQSTKTEYGQLGMPKRISHITLKPSQRERPGDQILLVRMWPEFTTEVLKLSNLKEQPVTDRTLLALNIGAGSVPKCTLLTPNSTQVDPVEYKLSAQQKTLVKTSVLGEDYAGGIGSPMVMPLGDRLVVNVSPARQWLSPQGQKLAGEADLVVLDRSGKRLSYREEGSVTGFSALKVGSHTYLLVNTDQQKTVLVELTSQSMTKMGSYDFSF